MQGLTINSHLSLCAKLVFGQDLALLWENQGQVFQKGEWEQDQTLNEHNF